MEEGIYEIILLPSGHTRKQQTAIAKHDQILLNVEDCFSIIGAKMLQQNL